MFLKEGNTNANIGTFDSVTAVVTAIHYAGDSYWKNDNYALHG